MEEIAIATEGLSKNYGANTALKGVRWSVPQGSLCGLLGPNGAGKTTILKLLLGMVHPTSGSGTVCGMNIVRDSISIRRICSFVPEDKMLNDQYKAREFLNMYGSFFSDWSNDLAFKNLARWKIPPDARIRTLSRGTRGKLLLIAALTRKPKVLILDEPSDGLDPAATEEMLSMLSAWVAEEGHTAVVATHRLDEVERVCDRVSIVADGRIILNENIDDIRSHWKRIDTAASIPDDVLNNWPQVFSLQKEGNSLSMITRSDPAKIMERIKAFPGGESSTLSGMNLREIYLAAVGSDFQPVPKGANHAS